MNEPNLMLYEDEAQTKSISGIIDFGEADIGEEKTKTIWAVNFGDRPLLKINLPIKNQNVSIISCPSGINVGEKAKIVLMWKPTQKKDLYENVELTGKFNRSQSQM